MHQQSIQSVLPPSRSWSPCALFLVLSILAVIFQTSICHSSSSACYGIIGQASKIDLATSSPVDDNEEDWLKMKLEESGLRLAQIKSLKLPNRGLKSKHTKVFLQMPHLKELDLRNNAITDLTWIGKLKRLSELNLASNPVTTLKDLGGLTRLRTLILSNCRLSGQVDVGKLLCLRTFIATDNTVTDVKGLGMCPDLSTLVLSRNNISTLDFIRRGGGRFIRKLSLSHNQISTMDPGALQRLPNVQELKVTGNSIRNVPEALKGLQYLKLLDLGHNQLESVESLGPLLCRCRNTYENDQSNSRHRRHRSRPHCKCAESLQSLRNLNLRGNEIEDCFISYPPHQLTHRGGEDRPLEVLDGRRLVRKGVGAAAKGTSVTDNNIQHKRKHQHPSDASFPGEVGEKNLKSMKKLKYQPHSSEDSDGGSSQDTDEALQQAVEPLGIKLDTRFNPFKAALAGAIISNDNTSDLHNSNVIEEMNDGDKVGAAELSFLHKLQEESFREDARERLAQGMEQQQQQLRQRQDNSSKAGSLSSLKLYDDIASSILREEGRLKSRRSEADSTENDEDYDRLHRRESGVLHKRMFNKDAIMALAAESIEEREGEIVNKTSSPCCPSQEAKKTKKKNPKRRMMKRIKVSGKIEEADEVEDDAVGMDVMGEGNAPSAVEFRITDFYKPEEKKGGEENDPKKRRKMACANKIPTPDSKDERAAESPFVITGSLS
eukprot:jgi/Bigna1/79345/fgenesh1_pg.61_\